MKSFKYKFTPLMKGLMCVAMALCAVGFGVNLYYCIKNGASHANTPIYPILQYALMFFVTVTLFALILSILLFSAYAVDGKHFKTRFGVITSKYDVEKIEVITLDRKTGKLTVTFNDGQFLVIVIKKQQYDDFVSALLKANPAISYDVISLESNNTDDDKK